MLKFAATATVILSSASIPPTVEGEFGGCVKAPGLIPTLVKEFCNNGSENVFLGFDAPTNNLLTEKLGSMTGMFCVAVPWPTVLPLPSDTQELNVVSVWSW